MSLAVVYTRANQGVDAPLVTIETHLSNGLPSVSMVGLPETAVKESRERVRSAILNAGLTFPDMRVTINMAPADIPKSGGRYDLAIALSILAASGQLSALHLQRVEILGELALSGAVRSVTGVLPAIVAARNADREMLLPYDNQAEAQLVEGAVCYAAATLKEACGHFLDDDLTARLPALSAGAASAASRRRVDNPLAGIRGQYQAKRALIVAAAGGHNMLMVGPPGTGKTLLANALPGLLPPLQEQEALQVASILSVAGRPVTAAQWGRPPFRAPHHSASAVAIVGGGRHLNPGEITLAHRGVLFLDELTEFRRHVLESLREPLESGAVAISRADYRVVFPAQFQLISAMNPCPCGYFGDTLRQCRCTPDRIARYLEKISGPLLDRIDLQVTVPRLDYADLMDESTPASETYSGLLDEIAACRALQIRRNGHLNARLTTRQMHDICPLDKAGNQLLKQIADRLSLSARACHRIIKLARTLADLEQVAAISPAHLAEAASFRGVAAD